MTAAVQPPAKTVSPAKLVAKNANPMRATNHPPRRVPGEKKAPNMFSGSVISDMPDSIGLFCS
jgi:hypothetical protein